MSGSQERHPGRAGEKMTDPKEKERYDPIGRAAPSIITEATYWIDEYAYFPPDKDEE